MAERKKYGPQLSNLNTFVTGLDVESAVQYLFSRRIKGDSLSSESKIYPETAIVRTAFETSDTSFIENLGIQQTMKSLSVEASKDEKAYVLLLEISGYTESYSSYVAGKINYDSFYSSLLRVVLPPGQTSRMPINNEIVLVEYGDPTDYTSVYFAGYPSETIQLDPNMSAYTKLGKSSGKNAFKNGAGQTGV